MDWDGNGIDDFAEFFGEIYAYQDYARGADARMRREQDAGYANAMACGFHTQHCAADAAWIAPLTGSEFHFLLRGNLAAIRMITSTTLGVRVAAWIMAGNVMTGSDEFLRGALGLTTTLAAGTLTLLAPDQMNLRYSSPGAMANTLLHEWWHYLGLPGTTTTACAVADNWSTVQRGVSACMGRGH